MMKYAILAASLLVYQAVFACAALTKKGAPCRNKARPGSVYCGVHAHLGYRNASSSTAVGGGSSQTATAGSGTLSASEAAKAYSALPQCAAVYADGVRCGYKVNSGTDYCFLHQAYDPKHPPVRSVEKLPETVAEHYQDTTNKFNKIKRALDAYRKVANGSSPKTLQDLRNRSSIYNCPPLVDSWGVKFRYENNGESVTVMSAGPDKKFDTVDDVSLIY